MKRMLCALMLLACTAQAQERGVVTPSASSATPGASTPVPIPPPVAETWLPRPIAELAGLDKITARLYPLYVRVGETVTFGSLRITLRACVAHGPDQPVDHAAYLHVIDVNDRNFGFDGWMILSDPAVAVLEHPVYDVKLTLCRTS